ncbi:MAG TPA: alpha/beta hydrolase [Gemmatimonadaceae bacterium]|nr:alpha/beta hydrolase [Gemmatimonadaceae bacterium]
MTQIASWVLVGLGLGYVGLMLLLWGFQERVVFQPPAPLAPPAGPIIGRRIEYKTSDGVRLFAYVVGDCTSQHHVMLAFHGNADIARWLVPWAKTVAERTNLCVVLAEYRGYDGLAGAPSYAASAQDALAALRFTRDSLGVTPDRLVLYGHSLGSAVAAELATVAHPRALVLQSPFTTAQDMARRMFVPGVNALWKLISRVHFDTVARVKALATPVSVVHGDRDFIIPDWMGRTVFRNAKEKGALLIVHGAGHNDVPEVGADAYWSWLADAASLGADATRSVGAATRSAP